MGKPSQGNKSTMAKKKQDIVKNEKNALKAQERLKRWLASDAYIPYRIPKSVPPKPVKP
jgi:hypothetical protein